MGQVVKELANFIQQSEPNIIRFSSQNIWRMRQFYETYKENQKLSAVLREISWTNHLFIISLKTPEEREFYLKNGEKGKVVFKRTRKTNKLFLF
jgi:hypothetical protein